MPEPEWEDEEWERIMRRAFPQPEQNGKRLYLIFRRAAYMVLAAADAFYGVEVDKKPKRR